MGAIDISRWPGNIAPELDQVFYQNIAQLPCQLDRAQILCLFHYISLLHKWNHSYNLSSIRAPEQMLVKHLFDSLSVCGYILGSRILDVGSGAGLPGIPLAIHFPQYHFVLLDAQLKRVRFLRQVVIELGLRNVEIAQKRVEQYRADEKFATVITRAFAKAQDAVNVCLPLCHAQGQFLLMTGTLDQSKLPESGAYTAMVHRLSVPLLNAERHLIQVKPAPEASASWEK